MARMPQSPLLSNATQPQRHYELMESIRDDKQSETALQFSFPSNPALLSMSSFSDSKQQTTQSDSYITSSLFSFKISLQSYCLSSTSSTANSMRSLSHRSHTEVNITASLLIPLYANYEITVTKNRRRKPLRRWMTVGARLCQDPGGHH